MAEKLIKFSGLIFFILLLSAPLYPDTNPAEISFKALKKSFSIKDKNDFEKEGLQFIKKYPDSNRVSEVKLLLADKETDTDLAIEKYRFIFKNYRNFPGKEYALYKICQILDLKSKWKELRKESENGLILFPAGNYFDDFHFMHITSCIMLEDYDTARNECIDITEHTHDFETLSNAIFLLAETERKRSGNSKPYIFNLKELSEGFEKSELYPSVIFRLAVFYEEKKDFNRAFSAYSDIIKNFPDSPESSMSEEKINMLKKMNPQKISYIPDNITVKDTDDLDLSPEHEIKETTNENYYSVSIGPFSKLKDTAGIIKYLKNYNIRKVKTAYGYIIYIGRYNDSDTALETRIRLAEEYGINGNIVRFSVHEKKSYIYEDR